MDFVQELFAGRYAIEGEIGRGSFGVVYRARDQKLKRPVALKILHPALAVDPATVELFYDEAATLASLDHPHIIPVYDLGVSGDARYIVMKYIDGSSLAQHMVAAAGAPQPAAQVLNWLRQIAAGLDCAHAQQVLHRDLKPGNLLVEGAQERILIADFGLAHAVQNSGGSSGKPSLHPPSGTVGYMAPEVLEGEEATCASDLYSLGCGLYELLAGCPPFSGANAMAIMFQHVNKPPPPLILPEEQRAARTSADKEQAVEAKALAAQVMTLLAKTPAQRPASGQAVVEAVAAAAAESRARAAAAQERRRRTAEKQARQKASAVAAEQESERHAAEKQAQRKAAALAAEQERQRRNAAEHTKAVKQKRQRDRSAWVLLVISFVALGGVVSFLKYNPGNDTSQPATKNPASVLPTPTPTLTDPAADALYEATGIRFVHVPAGEFTMGSPEGFGYSDEHPQHTVYLDAYYIGLTEVTNAQYARFVEAGGYTNAGYWSEDGWAWQNTEKVTEPAYWAYGTFNQPNQPVVDVSWYEAEAFTRRLSEASGVMVRLPTEAEWEKAACGVDERVYPWGDTAPDNTLANFDNSTDRPAPVGSYPAGASPYGALDMAGNVWEWTADWYAGDYYAVSPTENPPGPANGDIRVVRGGARWNDAKFVRCAYRLGDNPIFRFGSSGFRVVSPSS